MTSPEGSRTAALAPIQLADFKRQWGSIRGRALAAVDRVGESGWLILGAEVAAFERELATACGIAHVVGCASGLDALEICLRAAGVGEGDRVLTTPLSAFATALAIVRAGAEPVFTDVDDSGLLDLDLAERMLARDARIRAVVPVHLFGHALDMNRLEAIAEAYDAAVIEDCAQAIGARSHDRPVGSVGVAGATSFYPTKNLGALGDGGAVLTRDSAIAVSARRLRDYGQSAKYVHDQLGLNSRLDEVQAAILRDALLPQLTAGTARRKAIAARYRREISAPDLIFPPSPPGSESVWHLFPVLTRADRDRFRAHLADRCIASSVHYPVLISDQRGLREAFPHAIYEDMPVARRFAEHEVSLPLHAYLTDDEVDRVISACNEWQD